MGKARNEVLALARFPLKLLHMRLQRVRHFIEVGGKLTDLVACCNGTTFTIISICHLPRRCGKLPDGPGQPSTKEQQQHACSTYCKHCDQCCRAGHGSIQRKGSRHVLLKIEISHSRAELYRGAAAHGIPGLGLSDLMSNAL